MNCKDPVVFSVVGFHAGESPIEVIHRKQADIVAVGRTYWLVNSLKISPGFLQKIKPVWCYLIDPAVVGGAKPAVAKTQVKQLSKDFDNWEVLPEKITPVTGRISNDTSVLVFDRIEMCDRLEDISCYRDAFDGIRPVSFCLGGSTVAAEYCIQKGVSTHRHVMAQARFISPYCVFASSKEK